ncbi:ABC transporter substrate-binding protein [Poseidonocella sedimentorum]|uniref:NitT/TauT family transport system substrate-binding protein n=1 Tax=Poseidonocella sedimentorum TaxID=871652 RepID=A0A1I6EAM3_9RHOB|nr:ABC transporter substrate-binding protein [Poseidonocella sedimentorum]SFR14754.1 NitT/TauT family transport system substrate-binding protein [Poseidonocella sedimentorum]
MLFRAFAALSLAATGAMADDHTTDVAFALDWKFEGPAAPYFAAIDNGHFEAEGLSVEITAGSGSLDAIPKVATGAYPVGFADINSLVKFLDQNPGAPVIAAMMVYDKPPFAVIGRKSLGVETPGDLENKVLGAPPPDGAWAQFPIFAAENGLDMEKITVEPVGFPTREPMLAEGNVASITGFSFSSYLNLVRLGVPEDDISTLLMADYGLDLYGNAVIVNTEFAAENPDIIEGFLKAVAAGWKDAIADPASVMPALLARNPAADSALEQRRLELAIEANVVTDFTLENGMGGIDTARMESALEQIGTVYEYQSAPDASLYFTDAYLPEGGFALK